jgi:hypothetical protein
MTFKPAALALAAALPLVACASDGSQGPAASNSQPSTLSRIGSGAAAAGSAAAGAVTRVPSLVNVDLRNVLNDLAVKLNIDRSNVPITIQLPISLAANVCGVTINVLSASAGGGGANCTATTAPQELAQVVQQQSAAGGSVGGGAQGGSTAANGGASPTAGASTGGAGDTSATSTGASQTTTPPK